ncbi:MAG: RloB family protein [Peptostreptococcaceae bacterium]|nr:RloB family protein [Peptostreptococcaceae bacterium]
MGSDDLFKKKRKSRKERKAEYRKPKANSFLIVTEGERTEPLYFNAIKKQIEESIGGQIDIVPMIEIQGRGCSTGKLIEATEQIVKEANVFYQNIWVVFDKDDFEDFDQAITAGRNKQYHIAWSNQSFEYWLYLHFEYNDSALHREDWNKKLNEKFVQYDLGDGKYKKNYENIYDLVNTHGSVDTAIKNAKRRMSGFDSKKTKPSQYDPGTTVYELVEKLKGYLEE